MKPEPSFSTARCRKYAELAERMRQMAWKAWRDAPYPEAMRLAVSIRMRITADWWAARAYQA